MLLAEALMFLMPCLLWRLLNWQTGVNMQQLTSLHAMKDRKYPYVSFFFIFSSVICPVRKQCHAYEANCTEGQFRGRALRAVAHSLLDTLDLQHGAHALGVGVADVELLRDK